MKKFAIVIILFCTLYSAYSLDYRQVIFGNSYKNIIEIDADSFYEQYFQSRGGATRVYEQIIGENTFYRAVLSDEKLTEEDFLDWKNLEFKQVVYFKKSNTHLLQLDSNSFKHIDYSGNLVYTGLEIIERNNKVIGIMIYNLSESESDNNRAYYYSWQNILNAEEEWEESLTISFVTFDYTERMTITASNSLVDSKRPFMYTIQNAFDGNPATSYVEDTANDMFMFKIRLSPWYYIDPKCTSYMIINGYASGDYYYQNNQIAKVAVESFSEYHQDSHGSFDLNDAVKPQVMNFEAIIMDSYTTLSMKVEEITKGTRYNDTAIAEFDLYFEDEGWVFGSSDTDTVVAVPAIVYEYEYTIKDDRTAELKRYNGEATELSISSIIEYEEKTYALTSIGDEAFQDCTNLTSITIPNSVTSIGKSAFKDCTKLTSITIPDSVTSIGAGAFLGCSSLTTISIPDSVTSIGYRAFEDTGLTSITIPNSITSIGDYTFSECSSLTTITIPDSVTSIGYAAFLWSGLKSITIPSSVISIGDHAFEVFGSRNLTVSVYPDSYALEYVKEKDIPYILIN